MSRKYTLSGRDSKMNFIKQVALILQIRRPFSERKLSMVIIENNFDSDYIISHSLWMHES